MTTNEEAASGSAGQIDAKPAQRPVAEMSLAEVLGFLQGLAQATFQDINQAYSRLIAIGLFEHGYSDADRDTALGIAETVKVQILTTLADHPDLKAEFEQAAAMQIGQARYHGIGSDAWRAEEARRR
jgi:hypothetical protein